MSKNLRHTQAACAVSCVMRVPRCCLAHRPPAKHANASEGLTFPRMSCGLAPAMSHPETPSCQGTSCRRCSSSVDPLGRESRSNIGTSTEITCASGSQRFDRCAENATLQEILLQACAPMRQIADQPPIALFAECRLHAGCNVTTLRMERAIQHHMRQRLALPIDSREVMLACPARSTSTPSHRRLRRWPKQRRS